MCREDKRIFGGRQQLIVRLHPSFERIGFGFGRMDADVGGYDRKNLIARDHNLEASTQQARVFGGMPRSNDDFPVVVSDGEHVAVLETLETGRKSRWHRHHRHFAGGTPGPHF